MITLAELAELAQRVGCEIYGGPVHVKVFAYADGIGVRFPARGPALRWQGQDVDPRDLDYVARSSVGKDPEAYLRYHWTILKDQNDIARAQMEAA